MVLSLLGLHLIMTACGGPAAARRGPAPAGEFIALRELDSTAWPDLSADSITDRSSLLAALERSLDWFAKPSSRRYYPVSGITHEQARASVFAFRELLVRSASPREFQRSVRESFQLYTSWGRDGEGLVTFTGYYAPIFPASRQRTTEYRHPLYRLPPDLVIDSATGQTLGQRLGDRIAPYPTRGEIESRGLLEGQELVWLKDRFDAYLVHIQGSAMLRLRDGSTLFVQYAGNNGHEYRSVALALEADGHLTEGLSAPAVRAHFEAHPETTDRYLWRNPRFIFFREANGEDWPRGSLGLKLEPQRVVATDKRFFPAGCVVLVETLAPDPSGGTRYLVRFMVDQDTGGAIRSTGRADIFYGVGARAYLLAGRQYNEGRLHYLLLDPERLAFWVEAMKSER